jgi:hypothetical protein
MLQLDIEKQQSRVTEDLATLYLRLNGYFTSGFILHSEEDGKQTTEIDCIAVRFPFSREPEREVPADGLLKPSASLTDVVICEVKRGGAALQFNRALRSESDHFARVLRWIGRFEEDEIKELAPRVLAAFTPRAIASADIPKVMCKHDVRIRGFILAPERTVAARRRTDPFFIGGDAIFDYIWRCLCSSHRRERCSIVYDYSSWGHLERIVRYFKERGRSSEDPGSIDDLYAALSLDGDGKVGSP